MSEKKPFKWTPKTEQFCLEFLIDLNQAAAARRAGFKESTAKGKAHELCQVPEIRERINELMTERAERVKISADDVLRELQAIMLANPKDAYNEDGTLKHIKDIPDDVARCIAGIKTRELFDWEDKKKVHVGHMVEIKWWSKDKAIENAMRHLKLIGGDININIGAGLADSMREARTRVRRLTIAGQGATVPPAVPDTGA